MPDQNMDFSVSEFVALVNQTLDYAYGSVVIYGELANFRVTKNRWVYFDLKDGEAKLSFFSTIYNLVGPLEDGMTLSVRGTPRLHPRYGFSVNVSSITPVGRGTIKKFNELLAAKLEQEGLFAIERKRSIDYPPKRLGLITSTQSAAYADFIKIINARWGGLEIDCIDVLVQGDQAPKQIIKAIEYFSSHSEPPDVVVIIRGGGSPEDLAAFSNEQLTRAVAASRVPTMVAIGHESDLSLAELAADKRASTPSNAAELLVPDKKAVVKQLNLLPNQIRLLVETKINLLSDDLSRAIISLKSLTRLKLTTEKNTISNYNNLLMALSPQQILKKGYGIVRHQGRLIKETDVVGGKIVSIEMAKYSFEAAITKLMEGK